MSVRVRNEQALPAGVRATAYMWPRSKVLVTYSGPQGAQAVVDDLRRAGLPAHAEVLFAVPRAMIPIPSSLRRAGLFPASWYMRTAALPGNGLVGDEAIALAESWGADLVIVGSHDGPDAEQPYFSCMSPSVAARARCSVRVARRPALGGGSRPRLVVGIDGSPDADEAVDELARRRWPIGTAVRLVSVDESSDGAARDARLTGSRAASRLGAAGLEVSTELRYGKPVDELLAAAEGWHANCIVVGASGVGKGDRVVEPRTGLGAVSAALVELAPVAIEVVRASRI